MAADTVAREQTGLLASVYRNIEPKRVRLGQEAVYPITTPAVAQDVVKGAYSAYSGEVQSDKMIVSKNREVPVEWDGNDQLKIGDDYQRIVQQQFEQAMRTLRNEQEGDLAGSYVYASRAYGTPGTAPFQTINDYTDATFSKKILIDNGAPESGCKMVINSTAGAYLIGKQSAVDAAGSSDPLRRGVLLDIDDMQVRRSGQIKTHTKGTGTGYLVDDATDVAVGDTDIVLDTGSGTVLAGDVVNFAAAGTHNYVVGTGVAAPGTAVLANPGAVQAIADDAAMTIGNSYTANMVFHEMAIHFVNRLIPMPAEGDAAVDSYLVTDIDNQVLFEIRKYVYKGIVQYFVSSAWGWKVVKSEWLALLMS
jgi:hypothetical protein